MLNDALGFLSLTDEALGIVSISIFFFLSIRWPDPVQFLIVRGKACLRFTRGLQAAAIGIFSYDIESINQ